MSWRNGSVNMHAVSCIPVVTGAWKHEGGGALHSNSGIYKWNKKMFHARIDNAATGEFQCALVSSVRNGRSCVWRGDAAVESPTRIG